ncbi:MAG: thioredoxin family protein [Paracoccaceae bacterium]
MAVATPVCDFGWQAPDFTLKNVDGKVTSLADITGENATLVMFICNHCPYVKSILDRIIRGAAELQALGVGVVAINANDAADYPEDSFEAMQEIATAKGFSFPYLHDETQAVARVYGAACTPDFFGFDVKGGLQYRGRLDASGRVAIKDARRDLFLAMKQVVETGKGPVEQVASMGCSIKWKST